MTEETTIATTIATTENKNEAPNNTFGAFKSTLTKTGGDFVHLFTVLGVPNDSDTMDEVASRAIPSPIAVDLSTWSKLNEKKKATTIIEKVTKERYVIPTFVAVYNNCYYRLASAKEVKAGKSATFTVE